MRSAAAFFPSVVARIVTGPHDANRQDPHLPIRYGNWSAELGHPIEDLTAEDDLTPLPRWTPGAQIIADDGLVAEERVLHPALTWYPDACFQRRRPSVFTNVIVRSRVGDPAGRAQRRSLSWPVG